METPRVNDLLEKLLQERGEVCERNAPEAWVKLARQLERELGDENARMNHYRCKWQDAERVIQKLKEEAAAAVSNTDLRQDADSAASNVK